MKNTLKKLSIALIFVVTIVLGYSPSYAIETATNIPKCASCDVNLPQEALIGLCEKNSVYNDVPVLTTDEEIIDYIRGKMVNREEYIRVCTGNRQVGFDSNRNNVVVSYVKQAFEHTGNPVEGDYIERTWCTMRVDNNERNASGNYFLTVEMTYYTTLAQENQLTTKLNQVMNNLALNGKTDYQKIRAIYDYICSNISYDYENLDDPSYLLKYTAYAALMNNTAVCQGYATLLYRMALTAGVDAREITGMNHAWNIVKLGNCYFNLDSTWDAEYYQYYRTYGISYDYQWFLCSAQNFMDHEREDNFMTPNFMRDYPMAIIDFSQSLGEDYDGYSFQRLTDCFDSGYCGEKLDWYLDSNDVLHIEGTGSMWDVDTFYYGLSTDFRQYKDIVEEIVFDYGITSIYDEAFSYFSKLKKVTFADSIVEIGFGSFHSCPLLNNVALSSNLEDLGNYTFSNCTSLNTITIPGKVHIYGDYVFGNCTNLESVYFSYDPYLDTVYDWWDFDIFQNCTSLETITVEEGHPTLYTYDNALYIAYDNKSVIISYPISCSETSVHIKDGTTDVKANFTDCKNLEIIYFPNSISYIEKVNGYPLFGPTYTCKFIFRTDKNSYAYTWLKNNGYGNYIVLKMAVNAEIKTMPDTLAYVKGATAPDLTGGILTVIYDDDSTQDISMTNSKVRKMDFDGSTYGIKTLILKIDNVEVPLEYEIIPKPLKITYSLNGGTNNESNPTTFNELTPTFNLLDPTRTGYKFMGWYKESTFKNKIEEIEQGRTKDIKVYAKWKKETYSITYNLDGGTNSKSNPSSYQVDSDTITLKKPTKTGYEFMGWVDDATSEIVTTIKVGSTGNIKLNATWKIKTYTISYDLGKGIQNEENPISFTVEDKTITLKKPTRLGYTFKGWYKESSFENKVTEIAKGSHKSLTLYAKWSVTSYKITYNLDGGTNSSDNPSSYKISSKTIILKDPKKTGYTFKGWYDNPDFEGECVTEIASGSTGKISLYAKWEVKDYKVTYYLNDGIQNEDNPEYFTIESDTIKLLKPTKTGYTFKGWYKEKDYKTKVTEIASGSHKALKLYAKWALTSYKITYNLDEGTNSKSNPTSYNIESDTILLKNPKKSGYNFVGWYDNPEFDAEPILEIPHGSYGKISLYAKWEAK